MQNFKKMQKKCEKICIYEIKAVLLHRQKQIGEADNRQDAAFFIVRSVSKGIVPTPRAKVVMT